MYTIKEIDFSDNSDWSKLIQNSATATFFQTKDWLDLWTRNFERKPYILGIYNGQHLEGIAPFEINKDKINFLGLSSVLTDEKVSDFGDVITMAGMEEESWRSIFNYIKKKKKFGRLDLDFVRGDSPSFLVLKKFGADFKKVDVSPYINLPDSWDEYLHKLDRHNRHELRRKIRKLEKEQAFKICFQGDVDEIDEFFRLMAISNDKKRNFLSQEMKKFFKEILIDLFQKEKLRLCFLKLQKKYISSAICFVYKKKLLLYNSGYDPSFYKLSPGIILKAYMIKYAIENNFEIFDFLRGDERYKYDLGATNVALYNMSLKL